VGILAFACGVGLLTCFANSGCISREYKLVPSAWPPQDAEHAEVDQRRRTTSPQDSTVWILSRGPPT